jgi:hypothetical protein
MLLMTGAPRAVRYKSLFEYPSGVVIVLFDFFSCGIFNYDRIRLVHEFGCWFPE